MKDQKANVVFADPPYNLPISGHVSGNGKIQHREFVMASGEMSESEFAIFLTDILTLVARHSSRNGSLHYKQLCHVSPVHADGRQLFSTS